MPSAPGDATFGTWAWTPSTDALTLEPQLRLAFGIPEGALTLGHWLDGVARADRPKVVASWRAVLDDGRPREQQLAVDTPGGQRRVLARARRQDAEGGQGAAVVGVMLDVTAGARLAEQTEDGVNTDIDARKRSEHALRDSESWFRHLADALPLMVWAAGAAGEVEYANESWRRYTGDVSIAEWDRAVHPDDVVALRERWAAAVHRRERYEARCRLRRGQDGAWRWHSVRAVPILDASGELIRWLGAFVDDHELRMLVEQNQALLASEQRARQAAEDAGRMKDEFLATLGHELRTPLNAIVGWTSLLKRGLSQEETARAVEVIERNGQMQRRLIDELLDVSRIISGHVRLDLKPVVLEDVLAQAVEAIRPVAEAKGLGLEAMIEPVRQPITGDPSRLQQVFAKLLDNAVKFTPAGGRVSVRLDRAEDEVRVRLSDTGVGITPGFLPYVFDRFRQAESPGARRFGGLGLGLAIVRQIVHMHGGRVEAASAGDGLGAEFTVTLGLGGASAEAPSPGLSAGGRTSDGSSSPLRGLSMLIIEDDPDSREMLSVLLENAGAVPVAAASVTEALRLLGDLEIDVVLSDIGMPERDGFDLIRALRSFPNPRVRNAPALAVTAFARVEDRQRILAAGFDAHVTKPVEPLELFRAVVDVSRARASGRVSAGETPLTP